VAKNKNANNSTQNRMYCNPIAIAEELKHKTSLQNKAKLGDEVILLRKTDKRLFTR
jgi:hypothetical protein